jgi:hypothetical protein
VSQWVTFASGSVAALIWAQGRTITWDYVLSRAIGWAIILLIGLAVRWIWRRARRERLARSVHPG